MSVDKLSDQYARDMLRQGNLTGLFMKAGIVAFPEVDDEGVYSEDTMMVSFEDPVIEGNTLTFTLVTKDWTSE
jgi:hypothetical protein